MTPIPWPELIRALISSGLTQPQLAAEVGCGQSTISDLLNGKTTDPRTSTGLALVRLGNTRCALGIRLDVDPTPHAQPAAKEAA